MTHRQAKQVKYFYWGGPKGQTKKFTRGAFRCWRTAKVPGVNFHRRVAEFNTARSQVLIPWHALTTETLKLLPPAPWAGSAE